MSKRMGNAGLPSVSLLLGLSADELTLFGGASSQTGDLIPYYLNILTSSSPPLDFTQNLYPMLFTVNSAIEGIEQSSSLTPAVKQQLLGEAKFMRGFIYFYLVNLYGDLPLALTTDYTKNRLLSRTPQNEVYQQIITDLIDAESSLSTNYLAGDAITVSTDRIRPTKWAATALLARVYLFTGDWPNAETEASKIIENGALFSLTSLDSTFLANNQGAIWQLQPVDLPSYTTNTPEARYFVLPDSVGPNISYPVYLSNSLVNSFETGDQRSVHWIDSTIVKASPNPPIIYYYAYKYKVIAPNAPVTEYSVVFRIEEQYLIRSEARAQQNNIAGAQEDLNIIRHRASLGDTPASSRTDLLTAILRERRAELFTEWGHRWIDLKRTKTIDAVMLLEAPKKGSTWNTTAQLYPFASSDLLKDPNLVQNPGY
ncbi:RagB/SusD family nutrient uptake outer membrane protein [Chitinophaga sp. 30R24]|uniref:RagB/SusD family nutrient uptake outer membrane protein n=1 Tax=Chitinophaga sp. 30R24 TaxID=3248838 RepID=UPI003B909C31